jgi:CRISPR-associated protein (TIGR03986 family)
MAFHNPYHFVPVKSEIKDGIKKNSETKKFEFGSHPHVTHDRYAKDTYSGRVICRLTAETAFVVGDKHDSDENKVNPTFVNQYKLDGFPAIPATTIRGLISSIVETASNSALRVLENETYSYRKKAEVNDVLKEIGLVYKLKDGTFALLSLCNFLNWNPHYCVKVKSEFVKTLSTFGFNNNQFYYYNEDLQEDDSQRIISEENYNQLPAIQQNKYERGIIRRLENEERKKGFSESKRVNELFIFCSSKSENFRTYTPSQLIPILPKTIDNFHTLADLRTKENLTLPFHPIATKRNSGDDGEKIRIKTGDLIYFQTIKIDNKEYVSEISFSAIWRDLVGQTDSATKIKTADTTFDFFREVHNELLPFNKTREQITLAEQMFGFVENNGDEKNDVGESSLAGRIYPSAAKFEGIKNPNDSVQKVENEDDCYEKNPTTPDSLTLLKILASPKPPSPAMYFKDGYIAKNRLNADEHEPQGRKFYLHNNSNEGRPWETKLTGDKLEKVKNQMMMVKPVRKDSVFSFYIDFENLAKIELGALLYALRPNDVFRHKIGLGKPIGLGTIKIDVLELLKIDREKRYSSLGLFESRFENINTEIELLRDNFRNLNSDICDILETIGNPKNIQTNVHYPKVAGKTDEEENFKWFVANDSGSGSNKRSNRIDAKVKPLKPIVKNQPLPTLDECQFND